MSDILSPEPVLQKCKRLADSNYSFINLWNCRATLGWMTPSEDGTTSKAEFMDGADLARLGISYDMLLDAIEEAGGAINMSGHYPVSEAIGERLKEVLGNQKA